VKPLYFEHRPMPAWLPWCGVAFSAWAFIGAALLASASQPSSVPCDGRYHQLCSAIFGSIERVLGAWPAHILYAVSFLCAGLFFGYLAWSGFRRRRAQGQ
jgi:hypothetical protein